ncbi:hypothetical protein ACFP81_10480 [Deinococcus lacus]|uniref:DUF3800 domain-containing protein n=1 Tax=Deinococcus lacus TaxID=392561 RepID=A0ABW1YDM5_9DEIO
MALWRAFIDDSASEDSLFFHDMRPKPIQKMDGTPEENGAISRACAAGIVIVANNDLTSVLREVNSLRWEIKRNYALEGDNPPRLHMRHLWGRKANADKGRNPFYHLSQEDRLEIARKSYILLNDLGKRYRFYTSSAGMSNIETQKDWFEFHSLERSKIDREIIYSRFRNGKHARRFYARATNPTMRIVASLLTLFGQFVQEQSGEGIVRYDTSDASKGFEAEELYEALHDLGWCKDVKEGTHGSQGDECLLQMADLASFYEFRSALDISRGLAELSDPAFSQVVRGLDLCRVPLKETPSEFLALGTHYLAARQFLYQLDADWVNEHLKSPATLVDELHSSASVQQNRGVHLVKETSYQHYLLHGSLP